jgi:peptidoglycan-associated lipoprotein
MRSKMICVVAALVLVAACESMPEDTGAAGGSGVGTSTGGIGTGGTGGYGGGGYGPGGTGSTVETGNIGAAQQELVQVGDRVFFGFDQYSLDAEARQTLDRQAALLRRYGTVDIIVEGHTDERGTREYNLALGDRRANAVRDYLIALGISPDRIRTVSYGEERPAVLGSTEQAWAQNRRAVTVLGSGRVGS